ncbi:MAG: hypothetical protein BWY39_01115 [Spirochaetes bacterium ADurb.Bin269]|nr:MAG: hypothetical protein BWY39_01115 [Spirochaetes bacterium ADurb.Bin269]
MAAHIHHSLKATETYLEKFKRVAYLVLKGFTLHEIARVVGISTAAAQTYRELHAEFRNKALCNPGVEPFFYSGAQFRAFKTDTDDERSHICRRNAGIFFICVVLGDFDCPHQALPCFKICCIMDVLFQPAQPGFKLCH